MQAYLVPHGIEILTTSGSIQTIPYDEAKAVCFLRDFEDSAAWIRHRAFGTRPKTAGLWIRVQFRDGDSIEGMIGNDLSLIDPLGTSLVPPDPGASAQRIFIPRSAARSIQVLGVIGSPLRRRRGKHPGPEEGQLEMFG
jgi:hypothetical protein